MLVNRQANQGFGMLDIMLATMLLAGLIVLISSTLSNNKGLTDARNLGEQLAPAFDALIQQDQWTVTSEPFACSNGNGYVSSLGPGYIDGLNVRGVDLCSSTVTVTSCQPGSSSDPCR